MHRHFELDRTLHPRGRYAVQAFDLPGVAEEFVRFAATARATQAMLRGTGVSVSHFRPSVRITLWS